MHHGIALSGRTGFEYRTGHVPLQHMYGAAHGVCQMGELVAQKTFPRARQTSKEYEPLCTGQPLQVSMEPWVYRGDEVTCRAMGIHTVSSLPWGPSPVIKPSPGGRGN